MDDVGSSGGAEIASHMAKYEPIKRSLAIIESNVQEVNALKAKNKTTANEKARKGRVAADAQPQLSRSQANCCATAAALACRLRRCAVASLTCDASLFYPVVLRFVGVQR